MHELSPSEARILELLCEGHRIAKIAKTLNIGPSTVSTYLFRATLKLNAKTSTHAAIIFDRARRAAGVVA